MSWIGSNWILIVLIGGLLLMHLGHGRGHGSHGRHAAGGHEPEGGKESHGNDSARDGSESTTSDRGHRGC